MAQVNVSTIPSRHRQSSAAPAAGTWAVGEVVWNTAPASNGAVGWVCTVAGTPGTWEEFGKVGDVTFSRGAGVSDPVADDILVWRAPFACTLTNIRAYQDTGTGSEVNAFKGSLASPTLFRAANYAIAVADTVEDAGSLQNTSVAAGDKVYIRIASVSGSPNEVIVQLDFTRTV